MCCVCATWYRQSQHLLRGIKPVASSASVWPCLCHVCKKVDFLMTSRQFETFLKQNVKQVQITELPKRWADILYEHTSSPGELVDNYFRWPAFFSKLCSSLSHGICTRDARYKVQLWCSAHAATLQGINISLSSVFTLQNVLTDPRTIQGTFWHFCSFKSETVFVSTALLTGTNLTHTRKMWGSTYLWKQHLERGGLF